MAVNQNPLRIFSEEELEMLSPEMLKPLKKAKLLQFQLTDASTVDFNGYQVDKNEVLEIFELLKTQLPFQLALRENPTLDAFLHQDDFTFFFNFAAQQEVLNSEYAFDLTTKIAERLNEVIPSLIFGEQSKNAKTIKAIRFFVEQTNPSLQSIPYNKAYSEGRQLIDDLEYHYPEPFRSTIGLAFHPELSEHIRRKYYRHLSLASSDLEFLANEYAVWCNNNIVVKAIAKDDRIDNYPKDALNILRDAALIAAEVHNPRGNKNIASICDDVLTDRRLGRSAATKSAWRILLAALFFIGFVFRVSTCTDNYSSSNYDLKNYTNGKDYLEDFKEQMKYSDWRNLLDDSAFETDAPFNKSYKARGMSGDSLNYVAADFYLKSDYKSGVGYFYESDILPTNPESLLSLIPSEDLIQATADSNFFYLNFIHKSLPNQQIEYKLVYAPNSADKWDIRNYRNKAGNRNWISVKNQFLINYHFEGIITNFNGMDLMNSKSKRHFQLDYVLADGAFHFKFKDKTAPIALKNFEVDDIVSNSKGYTNLDSVRAALVIYNLRPFRKMMLLEKKNYTIYDVGAYITTDKNLNKNYTISSNNAVGSYQFTSNNKTAVVMLKTQHNAGYYFFNHDTGLVEGMQLTQISTDNLNAERIEVYLKK